MENKSDHFLEILENLEILEILEIPSAKRPLSLCLCFCEPLLCQFYSFLAHHHSNSMRTAAVGMQREVPLVVRVSACRAFCRYLTATEEVTLPSPDLPFCMLPCFGGSFFRAETKAQGVLVAQFARIDSHDLHESSDSCESEIPVIQVNRPDAV